MLKPSVSFYRDEFGKLRKTRTGHYRFDVKLTRDDGKSYMNITGFRYDFTMKRILSPTLMTKTGVFTIAEIAPGEHDNLAAWVHKSITDELGEERLRMGT